MLVNLTWIVGAYVAVRMLALIARQFPAIEHRWPTRILLTVLATAAILVAAIGTYATTTMAVSPGDTSTLQAPLLR